MSRRITPVGLGAAKAIARAAQYATDAAAQVTAAAAKVTEAAGFATAASGHADDASASAALARDISNIDTTDDAVDAALNLPGSKSAATLSASIDAQVEPAVAAEQVARQAADAPILATARRGVFAQRDVTPFPSPPTFAFSLSGAPPIASAVRWGVLDGPIDILSGVPALAAGEMENGYFRNTIGPTDSDANRAPSQIEYVTDGDTAPLYRAFVSTPRFLVYINDQPCQATPIPLTGITASGGTPFYLHIPHPNPGTPMRVRINAAQAGIRWIDAAPTTSLQKAGRDRPKVAILGTSFTHNAGSSLRFLDSWAWSFGERFGVEVFNFAHSGAGYVSNGTLTIAAQVATLIASGVTPDLLIVEGSGNDIDASSAAIQAAAASVYADLDAAFPGVPVLVLGMGARGSNGETADNAAKVITNTKIAADAAPNVLGFLDPIGTVAGMPTYATGAAYSAGQVVKVVGSAMRARVAIASAPATPDRTKWENLSHLYGTGIVGAATGDGNRDVAVDSDGYHPTALGARLMEQRYSTWIQQQLGRGVLV